MPLTLPAHAAAALPFARLTPRLLHAHALVIGCCAPDLAYLFGAGRELSHGFVLGLPCGVLVGLLAFVWCERLVFPAAQAAAPSVVWVDVRRLLTPSSPTTASGWLTVIAALSLGTLTHLLWDGLTHPGWWPGSVLYPAAWGSQIAVRFWQASTVIGSVLVLAVVYRRHRTATFIEVRPLAWAAMAITLVLASATYAVGRAVLPVDAVVPDWNAQMLTIRLGFASATLWCWFLRLR